MTEQNDKKVDAVMSATRAGKYTLILVAVITVAGALPHIFSGMPPKPTWADFFIIRAIGAVFFSFIVFVIVWAFKRMSSH